MASHPRRDGSAGWDGSWVIGWVEWRMGAGSAPGFTPLFFLPGDQEAGLGWPLSAQAEQHAVGKMARAVPVLAT